MIYLTEKDHALVSKKLEDDDYDIYKARDGTIVSLYSYNGTLCMASGTSPDISKILWNNKISFAEMFINSASKIVGFIEASNLTLDKSTNVLSWNIPENISVTVGFRNHNIHKLKNDPETAWLVHATDMVNMNEVIIDSLKLLPRDEPITVKYTLRSLLQQCDNPINIEGNKWMNNKYNYGFFLDSDTHRVFIPSNLYTLLRESLYRSVPQYLHITSIDRYIYNIMYLCICKQKKMLKQIATIIPELEPMVTDVINFVNTVCTDIKRYIQNPNIITDHEHVVVKIGKIVMINEPDYSPVINTKYDIVPVYVYHTSNISAMYDTYTKTKQ
jgi:hypothetical protein